MDKKALLRLLQKRAAVHAISIKGRLGSEPLRALSCLCYKLPSLYAPDGIRVKLKTFFGGEMTGVFPDGVSSHIYLNRFFEEGLTAMMIERLEEGMTFVDIGAHIGYFSVLASELVGPGGQVHSFEPTRSIFRILEENARGRGNIHPNNSAVFSKSMDMEFRDFGLRYSAFNSFTEAKLNEGKEPKFRRIRVKAVPLDKYVREKGIKPDFVKIDAESAEWEILQGMEKTMDAHMPAISLEVSATVPGQVSSHECATFLVEKGYSPYEYRNGGIRPHKIREEYKYDNLLFIARG
jgi:FkbM family methyltransferase